MACHLLHFQGWIFSILFFLFLFLFPFFAAISFPPTSLGNTDRHGGERVLRFSLPTAYLPARHKWEANGNSKYEDSGCAATTRYPWLSWSYMFWVRKRHLGRGLGMPTICCPLPSIFVLYNKCCCIIYLWSW